MLKVQRLPNPHKWRVYTLVRQPLPGENEISKALHSLLPLTQERSVVSPYPSCRVHSWKPSGGVTLDALYRREMNGRTSGRLVLITDKLPSLHPVARSDGANRAFSPDRKNKYQISPPFLPFQFEECRIGTLTRSPLPILTRNHALFPGRVALPAPVRLRILCAPSHPAAI